MARTLARMEREAEAARQERQEVGSLAKRLQARLQELEGSVADNAEAIEANAGKIATNQEALKESLKRHRSQITRLKQLEETTKELAEKHRFVEGLAHAAHKQAQELVFERFHSKRDEWLNVEPGDTHEDGKSIPPPPEGSWLGRYLRFGQTEQATFQIKVDKKGKVSGSGHDADGAFQMEGSYNGVTGRVVLLWKYAGGRLETETQAVWREKTQTIEGRFVSSMGVSGSISLVPLDRLKEQSLPAYQSYTALKDDWLSGARMEDEDDVDDLPTISSGLFYGTASSNGQSESTIMRLDIAEDGAVSGAGHDSDGAFSVDGASNSKTGHLWLTLKFQDAGMHNDLQLSWRGVGDGKYALVGRFLSDFGVTGEITLESAAQLEKASEKMYKEYVDDASNWLKMGNSGTTDVVKPESGTWTGHYTGKDEEEHISVVLNFLEKGGVSGKGHDADGAMDVTGHFNKTGGAVWLTMTFPDTEISAHIQGFLLPATKDGSQKLTGTYVSQLGAVGELTLLHRGTDSPLYKQFKKEGDAWLKSGARKEVSPANGNWAGEYQQSDDADGSPIEMDLTFEGQTIKGNGNDRDGSFTVGGEFRTTSGRVALLVEYPNELKAELHGMFSPSGAIEGEFVASTGVTGAIALNAPDGASRRRDSRRLMLR